MLCLCHQKWWRDGQSSVSKCLLCFTSDAHIWALSSLLLREKAFWGMAIPSISAIPEFYRRERSKQLPWNEFKDLKVNFLDPLLFAIEISVGVACRA